MQRVKNMAETLKFVHVLVLLISIFFVIIVSSFIFLPCITDKDCPSLEKNKGKGRCRKGYCVHGLIG
ncbi:putative Late nodulin [Medicago truncatula]|uniref:Putative Late nodulin n=1 Tax=Medicago truncatula TaxID=3880 RepID=A0A396IBP6_MEDTR|nr:putative Late nodulin [Medicago truncatula]